MPSAKQLLPLLGAALLAVAGTLIGSAWATGVGCGVVLGGLAVHPTLTHPAVPRSTRLLLRGGLLLLVLAVVAEVSGWAGLPVSDSPPSTDELIALVTDPVRQREQFLRQLVVASCLVLACGCVGVTIGRLPRGQLRRFGRSAPAVAVLTLVVLVSLAFFSSGVTGPLGSWTNVAIAALLVFCGYAWVVARAVRRDGTAPIAVVGATVLAAAAWVVVDIAWRSRPEPRYSGVFIEEGARVAVAVSVEAGLDVTAAVAVAVLLLGAALTVLACARLSTHRNATS